MGDNIKIRFIEGCQTRRLDSFCFSGCSQESRKIRWSCVVLLPSKRRLLDAICYFGVMLVMKHVPVDHRKNCAELNVVLRPSFLMFWSADILCAFRTFLSVSGVAVMRVGTECLIAQWLLSKTEEICCHLGCVKS